MGSAPAGEDDSCFDALFVEHYADLLRFAVRRVGIDAAPDVVAEVFLVAWRRRADLPMSAARLWLFGVAARVLANEQRSESRQSRLHERAARDRSRTSTDIDPADVLTEGVQVRAALARLSIPDQEVLRLTEWDGLTSAEAARVCGCSPGAFRVRLLRARRRLADRLSDQDSSEQSPAATSPPCRQGRDLK